ncbi:hypothetical protein LV779_11850 [Streptomyces thinghirensis]|nr:hypothetical protein [Streptomyces thinghirensis]
MSPWPATACDEEALDRTQLLELLALSEVVARKAAYGRHLTVPVGPGGRRLLVADRGRAGHQQAGRLGGAPALDRRPGGRVRPARKIGFDAADAAEARATAGEPDGR